MPILFIVILAVVQGLTELLPVSSSAHVIVAEKLLGLDPTRPEMTMLLVMLHTGTMFAVIVYFWRSWKETYFASRQTAWKYGKLLALATVLTGVVGLALKELIERVALRDMDKAEIEMIFGNLLIMGIALAAAGALIIYAGIRNRGTESAAAENLGARQSAWVGMVQGLCLPFRGFSRSGATISTGMIAGTSRRAAEAFSFALAVIITPAAIGREFMRLMHSKQPLLAAGGSMVDLLMPSLLGLVCSFLAGLLALVWLSRWLERGRWVYFGFYCLAASAVVLFLRAKGF